MFNEEFKRRFAQENYKKDTTQSTAQIALNKPRKFEEKLNKDFYEFSKEEINAFFQSQDSGRYTTLETALPYYRQYARFAAQETGIQNDYLINLTLDDLKRIVRDKIEKEKARAISREEIIEICSLLKNPRDRVILLGTYEGISMSDPNEFLEIKPNDIVENYITISSRPHKFKISDELSEYFKEAMEAQEYDYIGLIRERKSNLINGDEVAIKVPENTDPDYSVRSALKRISVLCDYRGDLTISNLKYSGMADKLLQFMDERQIPLNTAYKIYRPILAEEYRVENMRRPKILRMAEYLLEEREKNNG